MLLTGLARIGSDAPLRRTADNKAVLELSLAFNYGRRDPAGKRPTQWIKASLWGDRADRLAGMLQKGRQVFVALSDIHNTTYTKRDGQTSDSTMVATVVDIELAAASTYRSETGDDQVAQGTTPAPKPTTAQPFEDLKDDIPF